MTSCDVFVIAPSFDDPRIGLTRESIEAVFSPNVGIRSTAPLDVDEVVAGERSRYARTALGALVESDAEVRIAVRAGSVFVREPRQLIDAATARGLAIPHAVLPCAFNGLEPWAGTVRARGAALTDVIAAGPGASALLESVLERCDLALREF